MKYIIPKHNRMRRRILIAGLAFTLSPLTASAQYSVEYFWDKDPGIGKGMTLTTSDQESFSDSLGISVEGLSFGVHKLGLRALNTMEDSLLWSETHYRNFLIPTPDESIRRVEYFWDNDPGLGKGTAFNITPNQVSLDITEEISVDGLTDGVHRLWVRACSDSVWSEAQSRLFFIPATPHMLQAIEYFWDEDPGVGNGMKISIAADADGNANLSAMLLTDGLTEGVHKLGIRALTDGTWSETQTRRFLLRDVYDDQIGRIEYYWDEDPGKGNGKALTITPAGEVDFDGYINVMYLSGTHTMYMRAQSGIGDWSEDYEVGQVEVIGDFTDKYFDGTYTLIDKQQKYENHDEAAIYNKVEYKRTFSNTNWQALYVPFCMSYDEWMGDFEVARLNAVHQYDTDGDGDIDKIELEAIKMKKGIVEANTPYLIKARTIGEKVLVAEEDPALYVAEENSFDCTSMNARFVFTGTYNKISGSTMKNNGYYAMAGGKLSRASSADANLNPFRWYLNIESRRSALVTPDVVNVKINGEGYDDEESTGIRRVGTSESNAQTDATVIGYYSLNGTKLSKPQKGIMIVKFSDGRARKIVVK